MPFNINDFKQNVSNLGYAKNNKFEVFIQTPKILQNKVMRIGERRVNLNRIGNTLKYRIEQVRTPSVSLLSLDNNVFGIGPTQKMPYSANFFDTTFSILLDRNTDLWDFWYSWTNAIFNFNGQESEGNNPFVGGRIPSYTLEYKDNYSTIMMIIIYDDNGKVIKKINLYEAFPSSIREVQLAWNDNVNLMRLAISVTYSSYSIVGTNINSYGLLDNSDVSPLNPEIKSSFGNLETDATLPYFSPSTSLNSLSPVVVAKET